MILATHSDVGYLNEPEAQSTPKENYTITNDWEGKLYVGITLDWDYENGQVHLLMPGYVTDALLRFNHPIPTKKQD